MASETLSKLITYDDYRNLPDDGKQYQIIRGELYMTPAPTTVHQRILLKLLRILDSHVNENELGEVLVAPVDVVLSMTDVVQPDIVFIARDRLNIITKMNIVAAPDLTIEILSDHTRSIDRTDKKKLYESYKVREYWMVDPGSGTIEQYGYKKDRYTLLSKAGQGEVLSSEVIQELQVSVNDIF